MRRPGGARRTRAALCLTMAFGAAACVRPPAPAAPAPAGDALVMVSRAWPVMGTMFTATVWGVPGADSTVLLEALLRARDSVRLADSLMSTYRPSSELSQANRHAGGEAVRVSPPLLETLRIARRYWELSGGGFDPTIGPLVRAWGFHGDSGRVPPARELDSLRALVDFGSVQLDRAGSTLRLPRAGMRLDLGGVAKGHALDMARAAFTTVPAVHGVMLDLGGNVLVAGRPPRGTHWRLAIRDPRGGDEPIGVVALDSGAIATSGDYERFYRIDGVRYAHIIDPRTGRPARGTIAATAIGPTGAWSDGLSATLYLAGPSRALALADSIPGIGAVIVEASPDGESVGTIHWSARARTWRDR